MRSKVSDEQLYLRIQRDEQEALEIMFERYYLKLCIFATGFSLPKDCAEDIVSEVFIALWNYRNKRKISNIRLYLYTCVKNACLNGIREIKRKTVLNTAIESSLLQESDHEQDFINKEERRKLWKVIERLPKMQRKVLLLNKLEGLRYKEIAEVLNISPRTVQNHMVSAIKSLGRAKLHQKKV